MREYWLVDPGNRFIHAYAIRENGRYPDEPALYFLGGSLEQEKLRSAVLEGFTLDLAAIFLE